MNQRHTVVRKFWGLHLWAAAAWCIASGWFVPPAQGAYGQVPVFFFENRGQLASPDILYMAKGPDLTAYFGSNQVLFTTGASSYRLSFPGSNLAPALEASQPMGGRINFLLGNASHWKTNLPAYGSLTYRGIFPGIDLVYSASGNRFKSDFIVGPGADPSVIRLRYDGAGKARLEADGALVLEGQTGELRENAPTIYQELAGKRVTVEGSFRLLPDGTVGFHLGVFDPTIPLVIDPVLSYSTYIGGSSMDTVTSIAVDSSGNAYLAGWTVSTDLPTVNPVRAQNGGGVDAFVAKLGPGGNTLIYCTYLGGRGDDRAFGIAVDSAGNAYVTGWTASSAFPTLTQVQSTIGGGKDAFVAKLNPAGNALIYSTFLGGAATDSGNAIAVDAAGNAYVAGGTYSFNFPTASAYQSTNHGQQNAFVAKFNPFGSLLYSTYLGGNGNDSASAIAISGAGNAYVTGGTNSTSFPTAAPLQAASGGGQDAFVTKLNQTGNGLVYSTYLGGSGGLAGSSETGNAIALDTSGAAYIAGATSSTNFPITAGALQSTNLGGGDAFVSKLNPAGSALVYSTYLGGGSVDYATGIAVDFVGNAYITGYTASYDFLSLRAVQPGNAGPYDLFLTKLNAAGTGLVWSTYLGGSASDAAYAVAVDSLSNAYVAGLSQSGNFPLHGPLQSLNGGSFGGFVSKVSSGWVAAVFSSGSWYVDRNRNGGFDGTAVGDQTFTFGQQGDVPVAGDWNGSGTFKIGVFRSGQWLLDCNGNGVWDGVAGGDCLYTFGQPGDKGVVGDWTGSGTTKIGVFRGGFWMLDLNGNGVFDGAGAGDSAFWFGNSSYTPVVGDWTGSGATRTGLFINGTWYLDVNGDGQWVAGTDQVFSFGQAGDVPVVGDWSASGKSSVGVFRSGFWMIDMNGNGAIDGIGIGEAGFWLGNSSFTPVLTR